MTISNHSLLKKIEEEIMKAKQINDSSLQKQHVYTIKTLCELMLEDRTDPIVEGSRIVNPAPVNALIQEKPQPLKTDDGANGDSLFDF